MLTHLHPITAPQQTELPLGDSSTVGNAAHGSDSVAWQLGWDHARHGLALTTAHLHPNSPLFQGWQAAHQGTKLRRQAEADPARAVWLRLRLKAWVEGLAFEDHLLTPHYLAQLSSSHCPVTRLALHDEAGHPQARTWARLRQNLGYSAGHLVCLGADAAQALTGRDATALQALAAQAAATGMALEGLDAGAWARLAALVALVTPGACPDQALAVQPPNRLVLVNPLHALQAWVARQLGQSGWSGRLQALHDQLPTVAARQAASALAVALAPHALTVPLRGAARQAALEDLWLDSRVQRRWQTLARAVSPLTAERLLATLPTLQGVHMALHSEAWGLAA